MPLRYAPCYSYCKEAWAFCGSIFVWQTQRFSIMSSWYLTLENFSQHKSLYIYLHWIPSATLSLPLSLAMLFFTFSVCCVSFQHFDFDGSSIMKSSTARGSLGSFTVKTKVGTIMEKLSPPSAFFVWQSYPAPTNSPSGDLLLCLLQTGPQAYL